MRCHHMHQAGAPDCVATCGHRQYAAPRPVLLRPLLRVRDLIEELRGDRSHPAPQQETALGVVLAFLGWPCEFHGDCAYPGLGWRCGHRRAGRTAD
jgi:hypothetical protein